MDYEKKVINSMNSLNILEKSKSNVIVLARYGPSKPAAIPLGIDEKLSCFVAAIIGDGHLRKDKFQITLDGFNKELLLEFKKICRDLFQRDFNVTTKTEKAKKRHCLIIDSKAIYKLLNEVFLIPSGKKSSIVRVPEVIKNGDISIRAAFAIGILVTEGGRRRRGFGMSTASEELWKDLRELFARLDINIKTDKWLYKKYNKTYYGLSFKKEELQKIISNCSDKYLSQLLINCPNFN